MSSPQTTKASGDGIRRGVRRRHDPSCANPIMFHYWNPLLCNLHGMDGKVKAAVQSAATYHTLCSYMTCKTGGNEIEFSQ